MTQGAVLIGDNMLDQEWFSEIVPIGTWTDEHNLLQPQLEPAAKFAGGGRETGLEIRAGLTPPVGYNALALLGTDIGISGLRSNYNIAVEYFIGTWEPITGYEVHELNSPGSPRSLVIVFPSFHNVSRFRVRWYAPDDGRLGHVMLGRAIQDVEIADRGWGMAYPDGSKQVTSDGGQVYADSPQIKRQMTIQAGTMSARTAFGVQDIVKQLELPNPVLTGDVTIPSMYSGYLAAYSSKQGAAEWQNLLEVGKHYRIDFHHQQLVYAPLEDPPFPRWSIASSTLHLGSDQGFPTGRASVYGQAQSTSLIWAATARDGVALLKVLAVYEVDYHPGGWGYRSELANVQAFYARHGSSRPVIALVRPSDPLINRATGIYGHMTTGNELRQRADADGDIFTTTIRITEAR